jgi:hypothetical protein
MFESVNPPRVSRRTEIVTVIGSTLAHATIVGLVFLVPLLYLAEEVPTPPEMLAFVVATPPPPPPPPPPAAQRRAEPVKPKAVLKAESAIAAPVEAPAEILPERPVMLLEPEFGATSSGTHTDEAGPGWQRHRTADPALSR